MNTLALQYRLFALFRSSRNIALQTVHKWRVQISTFSKPRIGVLPLKPLGLHTSSKLLPLQENLTTPYLYSGRREPSLLYTRCLQFAVHWTVCVAFVFFSGMGRDRLEQAVIREREWEIELEMNRKVDGNGNFLIWMAHGRQWEYKFHSCPPLYYLAPLRCNISSCKSLALSNSSSWNIHCRR